MITRSEEDSRIIQLYYQEASEANLLSREEEVELFKIMHKWSHNKKAGQATRKNGIAARDTLIRSNLRLVIKIAKEFRGSGLDLADLINEGNAGLIKGVDKFELGKGAKLSHYAGFWIRQSIMRALANQGRTIRLPQGAVQQKISIIKFIQEYENKNGKRPSNKQIANKLKLTVERVILLNESSLKVASLNSPISNDNSEEESKEMGDAIADEKFAIPDEVAMLNNDNILLYECLEKLDHRERYIISKRFALDCPKGETLEVIGEKFGVTRERIRQVESQAMRKLKGLLRKKLSKY